MSSPRQGNSIYFFYSIIRTYRSAEEHMDIPEEAVRRMKENLSGMNYLALKLAHGSVQNFLN
jgi:hypothetical protein